MFLGWMLLRARTLQVFELSYDEGVNLIKALLLTQGHGLYSSVWSDQPPVFTYALSGIVRVTGPSVAIPRLGMLLASTAFVWGMGRHLVRTAGLCHALAAQTLVLSQPAFFWCSGAVMVGLPSIYLAFAASCALLQARGDRGRRWLLASALILSLSIMTKLFTALLVPVALVFLAMTSTTPGETDWPARKRRVIEWVLGLVGCLLGLGYAFVGPENCYQLLNTHLRVLDRPDHGRWPDETIWFHLEPVPWVIPLAILGAAFALRRRDAERLFFAGWAAAALAGLCLHFPVWEHQSHLLSLPSSLLGGYAIGEVYHLIRPHAVRGGAQRHGTSIAMVVAFSLATYGLLSMSLGDSQRNRFQLKAAEPTVDQLMQALDATGFRDTVVITDRPMIAFRAGRRVPPWTAVVTDKRLASGNLTQKELESEIAKHAPATVVLARFPFLKLRQSLERSHRREFSNALGTVWLPRPLQDPVKK